MLASPPWSSDMNETKATHTELNECRGDQDSAWCAVMPSTQTDVIVWKRPEGVSTLISGGLWG